MSMTASREALTIDPTTEEVYASYPYATAEQLSEIIAQSVAAQRYWGTLSADQRM
jgi:acyl-CoA reductase-like NAD-dependent aldehyde dehydrogenase